MKNFWQKYGAETFFVTSLLTLVGTLLIIFADYCRIMTPH